MAIDERVHELAPPVRDHVEPVPVAALLGRRVLDDLSQRREDGGAICRALDDVVDGVRERRLLEAAVDVPARSAHMGAPDERKKKTLNLKKLVSTSSKSS